MTTSREENITERQGGEVPSPQMDCLVDNQTGAVAPVADVVADVVADAPVTQEERQAMIKDITGKATSLVQLLQDYQDQERDLRDALLEFVVRDVSEQQRHMQYTRRTLHAQRECLNNAEYVQWALRHGKGEFSPEANALYGNGGSGDSTHRTAEFTAAMSAAVGGAVPADGGNAKSASSPDARALWPLATGGYMGPGDGCEVVVVGVNRGLGEALAGWRSQSTNTNNVSGGSAQGTASLTAALRSLVRAYAAWTSSVSSAAARGVWCLNGVPLIGLAPNGAALPPPLRGSSYSKADRVATASATDFAAAAVGDATTTAKPEAVVQAWWNNSIDAAASAAAVVCETEAQHVEALRRLLFGVEAAAAMSPAAAAAKSPSNSKDANETEETEAVEGPTTADLIRSATIDSLLRHEWASAAHGNSHYHSSSGTGTTCVTLPGGVIDGTTWESPDALTIVPAALLKRSLLVRVLVVGGYFYGVEPLVPQAALLLQVGFRGPREVVNACRAELARLDAAAPGGTDSLPRHRCVIMALVAPSSQHEGESALASRILDLSPLGPATPMCLFDWRDICAAASQVKSFDSTTTTASSEPFQPVFRGQSQRVVWDQSDAAEEEGDDDNAGDGNDATAAASGATGTGSSGGNGGGWDAFIEVWVEALRRRVVMPTPSPSLPLPTTPAAPLHHPADSRVADSNRHPDEGKRVPSLWLQGAVAATAAIACAAPLIARYLRRQQ